MLPIKATWMEPNACKLSNRTCSNHPDIRISGKNICFNRTMSQSNKAKTTKEWVENKKVCILEWLNQSPDLNPAMIWKLLSTKILHLIWVGENLYWGMEDSWFANQDLQSSMDMTKTTCCKKYNLLWRGEYLRISKQFLRLFSFQINLDKYFNFISVKSHFKRSRKVPF